MLVQAALVLTLVSGGIWVFISARSRSWAEMTLALCVLLLSALPASELRESEWAYVVVAVVAVVAVVSVILLFRERWRDPEWRASWKR